MNRHEKSVLNQHPCFNRAAARWFTHIHLPVASGCNIKCNYCSRKFDCVNENAPGFITKTISPREALKKVHNMMRQDVRLRVVGVAGPGEALADKETMDTLSMLHSCYPNLIKCISTNGLMLEESLDLLQEFGVKTVTVTVNAIDPDIARKIYGWVFYKNKPHYGFAGASLLIDKQIAGIREANSRGILVKVNTVLIPGINDIHLKQVAITVRKAGAFVMNVIPLVPQAEFSLLPAPSGKMLYKTRRELAPVIRQTDCREQCLQDMRKIYC
ncbi:radical SAM protein [Pelotomaculum propionicicum]|uniref:FeMo cofactor biosynthesis protein NifB n=1 Tax=Pelotomaculum propionicicum TaxID=258475 RepID=A0A4Y7RQK2_9FIRM|nr:radical SAM protein [Pelotomaculum propionicicum]TEB10537.1 FeMo cofactor biosynthesis protein NifB [Pelotomaculum propionicicum]